MNDLTLVQEGATNDCVNVYKNGGGEFYAHNSFLADPIHLGTDIDPVEIARMRDYQVNQVAMHLEQFQAGKYRHACVMPTGAGKTMTARFLMGWQKIRDHLGVAPGQDLKVLYVGGNRLLTQARNTFSGMPNLKLMTTTPGRKISSDLEFDLAIYDEGHHEAMSTWQDNLPMVAERPIVYLTATPDRADRRQIKVQVEVKSISRIELEERGLLAKMRVYSIIDANLRSMERATLIVKYVANYQESFDKTLITVKTHKEAKRVFQGLTDLGCRVSLCVDVTPNEVNGIIAQLENDEIDYIVNCDKLNEGVDIQGLTDVILGRQFGSAAELNQNVGRGIRPKSKGENIGKIHQFINPQKNSLDSSRDVGGVPESHWLRDFKANGVWREGQMA